MIQATAAALISVYTPVLACVIGGKLIYEGISDLIYASQAALNGQFTWA